MSDIQQLAAAPVISSLAPGSGPVAGNNSVFVVGQNLQAVTSVTVAGVPVAFTVSNSSGTLLTIAMPPHVSGGVPVTVTSPAGSATASYVYVVAPAGPTVSSLVPASGPTAGGTPFTIAGANLTGAVVSFNGALATNVVVNAAGTSLTGRTPAGVAGNVPVVVSTPSAGAWAAVPGGYTYINPVPPPTAGAINPATGTTAGGTAV
ncbi:IPT/TIG domain-containing protein, partial [Streptomyces kronopolitis]|uniref:IPT/TIG domain-containing protein n=1 Tax=Streptomyces kronopolitis TaxID=1612435 RepID=UPI00341A1EEB